MGNTEVDELALRLAKVAKEVDSGQEMLNLVVSTVGVQEVLRKRWERSGFPPDEFQDFVHKVRLEMVEDIERADAGGPPDEDEDDAAVAAAAAAAENPGECSACADTERWIRGQGEVHLAKRLEMVIPLLGNSTCCEVHLAMGIKIAHSLRGSLANFAAKNGSLERVQEIADKLPNVVIDHIQMTQPRASSGDLN